MGDYPDERCSACNGAGCDKKFGGKFWHKKCLRKGRKVAGGLL